MPMPAETTDRFKSSLEEIEVDKTQTTVDHFRETLSEIISEPAVGAPISIDSVSLENTSVTIDPTSSELESANTGVTTVELGIASYGSVVIRDVPAQNEPVSLFPDLHVAVLRESDIVETMSAAFSQLGPILRNNRTSDIIATGPSATADMGSLVQGAHGPKDVHVIILASQ